MRWLRERELERCKITQAMDHRSQKSECCGGDIERQVHSCVPRPCQLLCVDAAALHLTMAVEKQNDAPRRVSSNFCTAHHEASDPSSACSNKLKWVCRLLSLSLVIGDTGNKREEEKKNVGRTTGGKGRKRGVFKLMILIKER